MCPGWGGAWDSHLPPGKTRQHSSLAHLCCSKKGPCPRVVRSPGPSAGQQALLGCERSRHSRSQPPGAFPGSGRGWSRLWGKQVTPSVTKKTPGPGHPASSGVGPTAPESGLRPRKEVPSLRGSPWAPALPRWKLSRRGPLSLWPPVLPSFGEDIILEPWAGQARALTCSCPGDPQSADTPHLLLLPGASLG